MQRGGGGSRGQRGSGPIRGGRGGSRGGSAAGSGGGKEARAPIIDLGKYIDTRVRVKFTGGREVSGVLKGYDQLLNLVMDDVEEVLRDPVTGEAVEPPKVRQLGLTVLRGTALVTLNPMEGFETIENPFLGS